MTRVPPRVRGLVDPATGAVLALTERAATWLRPDGRRDDVTPRHGWDCAAVGGGAAALAGEGQVTWLDASGPVERSAPPLYRIAVSGPFVAGVTADGIVAVLPADGGPGLARPADLVPEDLAVDGPRRRVAVWGRDRDGSPTMVVLSAARELVDITPPSLNPPEAGLVFPLADGGVGVGTDAALIAAGRTLPLPGLERLAGSPRGVAVAWVRTPASHAPPLVGVAPLAPDGERSEQELPGDDPFPGLAVTDAATLTVSEGASAGRLVLHRLGPGGWDRPQAVDL